MNNFTCVECNSVFNNPLTNSLTFVTVNNVTTEKIEHRTNESCCPNCKSNLIEETNVN